MRTVDIRVRKFYFFLVFSSFLAIGRSIPHFSLHFNSYFKEISKDLKTGCLLLKFDTNTKLEYNSALYKICQKQGGTILSTPSAKTNHRWHVAFLCTSVYLLFNILIYIGLVRFLPFDRLVLHVASCLLALVPAAVVGSIGDSKTRSGWLGSCISFGSKWLIVVSLVQISIFSLLVALGKDGRLLGIQNGQALLAASICALPFCIWVGLDKHTGQEGTSRLALTAGSRLRAWDRRHSSTVYYLTYTVIFLLTALAVFSWFRTNDKSIIWDGDGMDQHINALAYWGDYLRRFLHSLFVEHRFSLPLWDFSIGFGSDVLTTLHYYVIGDPLTLLSAFVPRDHTENLYAVLIVLRFYLAGLAFSAYCRYRQKSRFGTLCGSLIYIFCGFALFAGVRHPYFMNPMIYFPLLLLGIEKIFDGKKPHLFILTIAISAASSFYFFYMLSVFSVLYALVRFFFIYRDRRLYHFGCTIGRFAGYYITGLLIACIIFLPVVMEVLTTGRMKVEHTVPLFYNAQYYLSFPFKLLTLWSAQYWENMAYAPIALFAIFMLLFQRKKNAGLKISLAVCLVFLLFPVFGYILHGFSYISNRWTWALSFLVALISTVMIPRLTTIPRKQFIPIAVCCLLYALAYWGTPQETRGTTIFLLAYAFLILLLLFAFAWQQLQSKQQLTVWMMPAARFSILLLTITSIVMQAWGYYSIDKNAYLTQFQDEQVPTHKLTQNASTDVENLQDSSFFRMEEVRNKNFMRNSSIGHSFGSTNFYFSIANPSFGLYLSEINNTNDLDYKIMDLDGRTMPLSLAGVKYLVSPSARGRNLPYGCTLLKQGSENRYLYKSNYALPFGYTYSSYIPRSEYDTLTFLQKQQAMMQGVVVDDAATGKLDKASLSFSDKEVPVRISKTKGLTFDNGLIKTTEKNASLTLMVEGLPNSEHYICLDNIHFYGEQNPVTGNVPLTTHVVVKYKDVVKTLILSSPGYTWYMGKHNYAVNTYYAAAENREITISFKDIGTYTLDGIRAYCQPMDGLDQQVQALQEDVLENVEFRANEITGTIQVDQAKILSLSIPYSEGWTAYIDGKPADILPVNTMYSGLMLSPGTHNIRLTYCTPYLNMGLIACGSGLLIWLGITLYHRRRKH